VQLKVQRSNPTHVLLYAYQRAELTKQACLSVLKWPELEKILITIDGLRLGAGSDERKWRDQTIEACIELARIDSRVLVKVWDDNPGLTNHIVRSMALVLKFTDSLITIEDDNLISVSGLRFLSSRITSNDYPQIAAGFNKFLHSPASFPVGYRTTLFPIQWTTSLNQKMFNVIEEVWEARIVDRSVVSKRIKSLKGINLLQRWRLISYWYNYFTKAMRSPRHTDIVVQYAAFKAGVFYDVPLEDYVEDTARLDWRGMNKRHNPINSQFHTPSLYSLGSGVACSTCDLLGSRIEISLTKQFFKTLKIRVLPHV